MTPVATRLRDRVQVELGGDVFPFMDRASIDVGDSWPATLDQELAQATLFAAFISVDYWTSEHCRKELDVAIARRTAAANGRPRILLILAEKLNLSRLTLSNKEAMDLLAAGAESRDGFGKIRALGDINFLGPYNPSGQLVRLHYEDRHALDDQLASMTNKIASNLDSW